MPTQINGLPAHVLLVHVVVVLIPVASLLVVLSAWWPAARRRLGLATPVLAVLSLAIVPVTTNAGQWLKDRLPANAATERHAELGGGMLIWVVGLAIVGVATYVIGLMSDRQARAAAQVGTEQRVPVGAGAAESQPGPSGAAQPARRAPMFAVGIVVAVLSTAVAAGTVVQVVRVGDSGSKSVWSGVK
jgi:hypothetical protein